MSKRKFELCTALEIRRNIPFRNGFVAAIPAPAVTSPVCDVIYGNLCLRNAGWTFVDSIRLRSFGSQKLETPDCCAIVFHNPGALRFPVAEFERIPQQGGGQAGGGSRIAIFLQGS